jgi:hypothetical protein
VEISQQKQVPLGWNLSHLYSKHTIKSSSLSLSTSNGDVELLAMVVSTDPPLASNSSWGRPAEFDYISMLIISSIYIAIYNTHCDQWLYIFNNSKMRILSHTHLTYMYIYRNEYLHCACIARDPKRIAPKNMIAIMLLFRLITVIGWICICCFATEPYCWYIQERLRIYGLERPGEHYIEVGRAACMALIDYRYISAIHTFTATIILPYIY